MWCNNGRLSTAAHLDLSQQHGGGRWFRLCHAGCCQKRELMQEAGHELDATLERMQRNLTVTVVRPCPCRCTALPEMTQGLTFEPTCRVYSHKACHTAQPI